MRCPKCNGEAYLTVIANDERGEEIISTYHCEKCKSELKETEVLDEKIFDDLKVKETYNYIF